MASAKSPELKPRLILLSGLLFALALSGCATSAYVIPESYKKPCARGEVVGDLQTRGDIDATIINLETATIVCDNTRAELVRLIEGVKR